MTILIPDAEVGHAAVDVSKEYLGFSTAKQCLFGSKLRTHDVGVTDAGNLVSVFKEFTASTRKEPSVLLITYTPNLTVITWMEIIVLPCRTLPLYRGI